MCYCMRCWSGPAPEMHMRQAALALTNRSEQATPAWLANANGSPRRRAPRENECGGSHGAGVPGWLLVLNMDGALPLPTDVYRPLSFYPPLPPRPFTPAGVKGSLNSQFGFFALSRGVGAGDCGAGLMATVGKRCGRSLWIGLFPSRTSFFPRFPPAPSPPRGVKGRLNSQFGCFAPNAGVGARGCGAGLLASVGKRCGRSQWISGWRGCAAARSAPPSVCKVSAANEHTRTSQAIGRAEQRSGGRIRAGACLSVASLRPTPGGASSARHPEGARPLARLSFAHLFFGEAKKSEARGRRKPSSKQKSQQQAKSLICAALTPVANKYP